MERLLKFKFAALCLIAFSIGCYIQAAPLLIVLYLLFRFAEGNYGRIFAAFRSNKFALLFAGFYLIHLLGMIYTPDKSEGLFDLQVKLSLFIFPFIFVSEERLTDTKQRYFIGAFIAGLIINSLICLIHAVILFPEKGSAAFLYSQLSVFAHPSYLAMYADLALVMLFYLYIKQVDTLPKSIRIAIYASVFFLIAVLVLLQSKTGLIVTATIILIVSLRFLFSRTHRTKAIFLLSGTLIIAVSIYYFVIGGGHTSRLTYGIEKVITQVPDKTSPESTQVRFYVWQAAWEVIKENPWIGTGTGYAKERLQQQYTKDNYTGALVHHLNAHNQYLQTAVELGIPALLWLLASFAVPMIKCLKEHRYVYISFILIVAVNFLTESMLETQGGTIFYGFFNSLFMFIFVV